MMPVSKLRDTVDHLFTASLSDRKGNSLFGEVDIQRKKLAETVKTIHAQYLDLKKQFKSKEIEIHRLRRENVNIKQEIQTCSSLLARGEQIALQTLSDHISELQNNNKKLEKHLAETENALNDLARKQNQEWVDSLLLMANSEARELKDKLFTMMMEKTLLADSLMKNQKDQSKARLECIKFRILLSRIIESHKLKINEQDVIESGFDQDLLDTLNADYLDKSEEDLHEITEPELSYDSSALGESTIIILGGREHLGNAVPSLITDKASSAKNEGNQNVETSHLKSKSVMNTPMKELQTGPAPAIRHAEKTIKFSEHVETKIIDVKPEEFEQSQQARKRPKLVFKRIMIPSKTVTKSSEKS